MRALYRRCVRAANTLKWGGYNKAGLRLNARLKQLFEQGSASHQQVLRTTEFLERAAKYNGTEYAVIRNMLTVEASRYMQPRRPVTSQPSSVDSDSLLKTLELTVATHTVPGPKDYSEAIKNGKLPGLPESTRGLAEIIKYAEYHRYADYDNLIKGLNETLGLCLPVDVKPDGKYDPDLFGGLGMKSDRKPVV